MTPARWQQIDELFHAAIELAPEDRAHFLREACSGDDSLRVEVESLIFTHEQTTEFLDVAAYGVADVRLRRVTTMLAVGRAINHYKILGTLGVGGMGEVYLAQDTRLDRAVALKILPPAFRQERDRLLRFEQEARAASSLNHPNILTIHEIGQAEGFHFIVSEYVEGETLRQRLGRGPIGLNEVLDVAVQIASGLSAAHSVGVIHRDIKPENVMRRLDGYVKVLDFGLAKLRAPVAADLSIRGGPRLKTDTGVVMGTVRYMSPEQARGLAVDARTDIWGLGVLCYEMLTGHAPFEGKTNSDVLVAILEREPLPIDHYVPSVPHDLSRIVTKALCKDTDARYQTIAELLIDLERLRTSPRQRSRFTIRGLSLLAASLVLLVSWSIWYYSSRQPEKSSLTPMKVVPFTSFPGNESLPSFSPDGNQIAFSWSGEKRTLPETASIYVKQIDAEKTLRLTSGDVKDFGPVWSPDGQKIAFNRLSGNENAIFIVPALGGVARKLLATEAYWYWSDRTTLAWSPDGGFIAFSYKPPGWYNYRISIVSIDTLTRHDLTSPQAVEILGDFNPAFSPDGKSVAFIRTTGSPFTSDIYIVPLTGGEPRRVTRDNVVLNGLAWTGDGREIVFSSGSGGNKIFNLWRVSASGDKQPERVAAGGDNALWPSISRQGTRLAYAQIFNDANIYRAEMSATTGLKNPVKLIDSTQDEWAPRFSADGRKIAFESNRSGDPEIWMCDSDGANLVRVTTLRARAFSPSWSPDGNQIVFCLSQDGKSDIFTISVDGGPPRRITSEFSNVNYPSWSKDGKFIYLSSDRTGVFQVWKVPAQGGEPVRVTPNGGEMPHESLDGKYVYYLNFGSVWRMPVGGGEELKIFDQSKSKNFLDWAIVYDGFYLFNRAPPDVALEFFDFKTREVKQVVKLGQVKTNVVSGAISPDHRHILYTQVDQIGSDIMLVENFR